MLRRKQTPGVEDLASIPIRTLQAALKASEEREAKKRKTRGQSSGGSKRKLAEKRELEEKLKQLNEELGDGSTDYDESEDESEEERPAKRMRKPTPRVPVASTSTGVSKDHKIMSKRDSCTWCRSHGSICIWDGTGTPCTTCKKSKRGCDRWVGGDSEAAEARKTQGDLEKFAENLEKRLGRMEKVVDRIGEQLF